MKNSILLLLLFNVVFISCFSQSKMGAKKALLYHISVNNIPIESKTNIYAINFDKYNYDQSIKDEFEKNSYAKNINRKITEEVTKLDFNEKFELTVSGTFGEYSFYENSFPVYFSTHEKWLLPDNGVAGTCEDISLGEAINIKDFVLKLNMREDVAKQFIKKRKDLQGKINRNISIKIIYSIVNKKVYMTKYSSYLTPYYHYIEIYDLDCNQLIYPKIDYYDKIHGVKMKEGKEIIYYQQDNYKDTWTEIPTEKGSDYYRIIVYADGKISSVKDYYYLSKQLQMEGTFGIYSIDAISKNGIFTYYYDNGFKKEVVNYINGIKHGCDFIWGENGKCLSGGYANYVRDGVETGENKNCPCIDQTEKQEKKDEVKINNISLAKGIHAISSNAILLEFTRGQYRYKSRGINIKPISYEINSKYFQISFEISTAGENQDLLLYTLKTYNEFDKIIDNRLYIIDDLGNKYISSNGFDGGNQKEFNNSDNQIDLSPNENIIISSKFQPIKEGVSKINFFSPELAGHQGGWKFMDINLAK